MFSIKKRELLNASDGFKETADILNRLISELRIAAAGLGELSNMDEVLIALRMIEESMYKMDNTARRMKSVAEEVVINCENADRRVSAEYDNANIHIFSSSVNISRLDNLNKILKDVPFEF